MACVPKLMNPAVAGGSAVVVVIVVIVVALIAGGPDARHPRRPTDVVAPAPTAVIANGLPVAPGRLAADIERAQQLIDDRSSTARELQSAGLVEQLATLELGGESRRLRRATLALLGGQAAASMGANLDAAAALSGIARSPQSLPRWRIVQPPPPNTLLGYFQGAESRFGVPWQDLAAIEFVETRFGRVRGVSPAGARGPMQFLAATWARYGRGDINGARDAVFGAARYLVANGAPGHMPRALYHYNNSDDYVRAVEDYARRMRADSRAYYAYYDWQVMYARAGSTVILPVGYPKARPVPLAYARH
jgi:hypothetical protein